MKQSVGVVGGRGTSIRSQRQHEVGVEIHEFNASCELFADRQLVKHKTKKTLPMSTTVYLVMLQTALPRTLAFNTKILSFDTSGILHLTSIHPRQWVVGTPVSL